METVRYYNTTVLSLQTIDKKDFKKEQNHWCIARRLLNYRVFYSASVFDRFSDFSGLDPFNEISGTMTFDCRVTLRNNPIQHKRLVRVGCGAGFAGDRPCAAMKLLTKVQLMDYLVLECLAERTLAIRHAAMMAGGKGYDPRISQWMKILLPEAVKNDVCIITNMGATDPLGAQEEVLKIADQFQLQVTVGIAWETFADMKESKSGSSTYLGAAPIVQILETSKPNVIITSRVADASLFLGPMIYELGWNWNDFHKLAQGTLAGHLLECGCQVTGGYFAHPADDHRSMPVEQLLDISLPYAEVSDVGDVIIAKPKGTGGELSYATCAEQLLYEVGDPSAYITPDLIVDFTHVTFEELTTDKVLAKGALPSFPLHPERLLRLIPQEFGWKVWGEISYGGDACVERAKMAETLVMSWIEESIPGSSRNLMSYLIGIDSLFVHPISMTSNAGDVRLRIDGRFLVEEQAIQFVHEFEALYTNGPAGGGGISVGYRKEMVLEKTLVEREETFWNVDIKSTETIRSDHGMKPDERTFGNDEREMECFAQVHSDAHSLKRTSLPAPAGVELPLYKVVHSRTGDKGNDLNISLIPHCASDLPRLQCVVTKEWVREMTRRLPRGRENGINGGDEEMRIEIYGVEGIHAMNVVIRNALDGGVNVSRRVDRHGKSLSDLLLCQPVTLPPPDPCLPQ